MINLQLNPALLFTPGNKPTTFSKAEETGANGIIVDLEDSVSTKDKQISRDNAVRYLSKSSDIVNILRINHLTTNDGLKDILAVTEKKLYLDAVLYPKTESPNDIYQLSQLLSQTYDEIALIALIETAQGTVNLHNIVRDSPAQLQALMFGAADYASALNCDGSIQALLLARMKIVESSAMKNLTCYDSPYFDFNDNHGLMNELKTVKSLGFNGKAAIHPKQINQIKSAFKPTLEQYVQAKEIVETYNKASGEACQYKGKMIDKPVYQKSMQVISNFENLR
ncbi:CoA ester lyase [Microbulbifer echini]|uniref:CoA ester lyase n=1 Tax=Microbulbifer echini TaxID=1529067 RepID=A0ABV4NQA7_9GAMM